MTNPMSENFVTLNFINNHRLTPIFKPEKEKERVKTNKQTNKQNLRGHAQALLEANMTQEREQMKYPAVSGVSLLPFSDRALRFSSYYVHGIYNLPCPGLFVFAPKTGPKTGPLCTSP